MRIKDINHIPEVKKRMKQFASMKVLIGVIDSGWTYEMMLATVHEYGARIKVTKKMRAYMARRGWPLRKETEEIHIPETAFMRSAFDENQDRINQLAEEMLFQVIQGTYTPQQAWEIAGKQVRQIVTESLQTEGLELSGDLRDSITYKVVDADA